ncbi:hypothetical protein 0305phi8-36p177 [Bacillus phage 0305phi8-36]|uniref:hypothetical protein n=1 Tax=Bacillus phage 0305phi8-36 TaxID=458639 RepID=UPI00015A1F21|nr:hypothetical protein ST0305phi8-36p177 [Bacillus phage 0305phi8-36]ABS83735.1 hypothetical protein 0305phi8-36p177 [Bacillus phage 0305phi8-36]
MGTSVIVSIISGLGVIGAAILSYFGQKKGSVATSEQKFREDILAQNEKLQRRVDELEQTITNMRIENRKLQLKVIDLEDERKGGASREVADVSE